MQKYDKDIFEQFMEIPANHVKEIVLSGVKELEDIVIVYKRYLKEIEKKLS